MSDFRKLGVKKKSVYCMYTVFLNNDKGLALWEKKLWQNQKKSWNEEL